MPEIRFSVTKKFNENIQDIADRLGVDKSDYVKSLIISDLKKRGGKRE